MFDLTGKRALVTGSTQGIGFEIAKTLAEHGATVYVHGVSSMEKCKAASGKIPNSIPVLADLCDTRAIDTLYAQTGDVDILVLNASVQYKKNVIMVYDWKGKFVNQIALDIPSGIEPENISLVGDAFYIACNNSSWSGGVVYKTEIKLPGEK